MNWTLLLARSRRNRLIGPLALSATVVAFLVVNEAGYQRAGAGIDANQTLLTRRAELRRLQVLVVSAETGQRGYLLTAQPEFREPYEKAVALVGAQLDKLRRLYADVPAALPQLARIESLTQQKLAEMQTTLKLHDEGRVQSAVDMVSTGIGREYMGALEALLTELIAVEQLRTDANQLALRNTLWFNRLGIDALVLLSLLSVALYLRQTHRLDGERENQQRELQAQHDQLEHVVAERTRELTEIAIHLQTVREDERSRLARELHDELGGLLTTAKLDVARVKSRLREAGPEVAERIKHLVTTLDAGISLKRRIIEDLRPSTLSNLGLRTALKVLCTEFAERSELVVDTDVQDLLLSSDLQLTVYRLVQESLTNIAKYAKAGRVEVRVLTQGLQALVTVVDDGVGFDTRRVPQAAHGLAGMRFRVGSAGGTLAVLSKPGEGTRIEALLPLAAEAEAEIGAEAEAETESVAVARGPTQRAPDAPQTPAV